LTLVSQVLACTRKRGASIFPLLLSESLADGRQKECLRENNLMAGCVLAGWLAREAAGAAGRRRGRSSRTGIRWRLTDANKPWEVKARSFEKHPTQTSDSRGFVVRIGGTASRRSRE